MTSMLLSYILIRQVTEIGSNNVAKEGPTILLKLRIIELFESDILGRLHPYIRIHEPFSTEMHSIYIFITKMIFEISHKCLNLYAHWLFDLYV